MATQPKQGVQGMETRTGSDASFNFQATVAPQQVQAVLGANLGGTGTAGGQITGGVVRQPIGGAAPALPQFLQDRINKDIEKKQTEAFYNGLTEARQGTAIKEIAEQRPWYSDIFGPDTFLQGAQYYTAMTKTADYELRTLQDMEELKKLPGSEIGPLLNETAQSMLTGDPGTDALIQKDLINKSGTIIDQHTKKRYEYLQGEAVRTQNEYTAVSAASYQKKFENYASMSPNERQDPINQKGLDEATRAIHESMQPIAGQSDASYTARLKTNIVQAAQEGNFHAVREMKKYMSVLPMDDQIKLTSQIETHQRRAMNKVMATDFAMQAGLLTARGQTGNASAAEMIDGMQRMNEQVKTKYGFDTDYFDLSDMRQGVTTASAALQRAQETQANKAYVAAQKAATAEEKTKAEALKTAAIQVGISTGTAGQVAGMDGMSMERVQSAGMANYKQLDPHEWRETAKRNYNNSGTVFKMVADKYQGDVAATIGGDYTTAFENNYREWQQMYESKNGEATAAAYWGSYHPQMVQFHGLREGGMDEISAYRASFGDPTRFGTADIGPAERKDAYAAIDEVGDSLIPFWTASRGPLDSSMAVIKNSIGLNFAKIRKNNPSLSTKQVATQAFAMAKANGLSVYNQWAWQDPKGVQPFHVQAGVAESDMGEMLNSVLKEKAFQAGVKTTGWQTTIPTDAQFNILRMPDTGGVGKIAVTFYDDDGIATRINLTSQEVKDHRNKAVLRKRGINPTSIPVTPAGLEDDFDATRPW